MENQNFKDYDYKKDFLNKSDEKSIKDRIY